MKVGFAAIVGRPNVGKSTFLNLLVNHDLSIVAKTPQTTRDVIKGIYNSSKAQIIFLDTPGIHKPKSKLGEILNISALNALRNMDLIIFLTPSNEKIGPGDRFVLEKILQLPIKKFAIITKTDLVKNEKELKEKANEIKKMGIETVFGISLLNNYGLTYVIDELIDALPNGDPLYNDFDELSDKPITFFIKEIIRSNAIFNVYDEVVHSIGVIVDDFQNNNDEINICAQIIVERDSQKGILIGKNASMIKKIGINTRESIAKFMGMEVEKIHLNLFVKVEKNWTKKPESIKLLGYK